MNWYIKLPYFQGDIDLFLIDFKTNPREDCIIMLTQKPGPWYLFLCGFYITFSRLEVGDKLGAKLN